MKQEDYNADDIENILEIVEHPARESLTKLLDQIVKTFEAKVLTMDLNDASFAKLGVEKARYEGAKALAGKLKAELNRVASMSAKENK